ncbi:MarR family transcriptional regulator [Modicisalibacter luteus]|jgi:MarR family transcriptional regulator for hemolysin|uniref:MarR family transcriptional regulator n=1 Tax=Modicisalibacter luteus TaxID=453962 RepID=A0ABV7LZI2_9GAMM|nr:MarR family transcriptional regulator [Halomonas lutea]GHA97297.1 MarR family transcriptional regulator [Halomonas lutea]
MLNKQPCEDSELGLRLGHAHRLWRMVVDHTVAPLGLTQPRWTLLVTLRHLGEGATQKQLAEALGIELPSLTRTLAQLEQQRLILRRVPSDDRRVREIVFTPAGWQALEALDARASEARALLLDGITDEEREVLHRALHRIECNASDWLSFR